MGKNKLSVDYRWQNANENFAMPVRVTIAQNKFDFIYPATSWKSIEFENLVMDNFKVEPNKLITSSVVIIKLDLLIKHAFAVNGQSQFPLQNMVNKKILRNNSFKFDNTIPK